MNGKKMAAIIVGIIIVACLASVISISLFYKYYEPKPVEGEVSGTGYLTPSPSHFIITLNSR